MPCVSTQRFASWISGAHISIGSGLKIAHVFETTSRTQLNDASAVYLGKALQTNSTVTSLTLLYVYFLLLICSLFNQLDFSWDFLCLTGSENHIGNQGACALAQAFAVNTAITSLNLWSGNEFFQLFSFPNFRHSLFKFFFKCDVVCLISTIMHARSVHLHSRSSSVVYYSRFSSVFVYCC